MNHPFITLFLALGLLAPAAVAAKVSFPNAPQTREQAKKAGKPSLILWYGSDWTQNSSSLCREWEKLASAGLPVVIGQFDEKTGLKEEDRKAAAMPIDHYNLPVAILAAPDGTFMACYDGKTVRSASAMTAAVKKSLAKLDSFTSLVQQARTNKGTAAAESAGKALCLLRPEDAYRHKALKEIIRRGDPDDSTGYRVVFDTEHIGMYGQINQKLKGGPNGKLARDQRDFDGAEAYVRGVVDNKEMFARLTTERQQQWLAGLAYVQRERMTAKKSTDRKPLLSTLKRIVKLDPKSEYGKGARKLFDYWNPTSFYVIKDFYDSGDQTHGFEKDWHVDVTKMLSGPGTYTFSLVPHENGRMVTRNYRLVVNGKEVARPGIDAKQNTKTVDLTLKSLPSGAKVEVWLTAQCNDGWLGCTGHFEMKKK